MIPQSISTGQNVVPRGGVSLGVVHLLGAPVAAAQSQINLTSNFESLAFRWIIVYEASGMLPEDTASQINMRSLSARDWSVHAEKSSIWRPSLTCLETIHETGATRLYHGQFVRLEWQSWHERFRIAPTCGFTTSAICPPIGAEVLGIAAIEENCIPRKINPSKIKVSFASRRTNWGPFHWYFEFL